MPWPWPFCPTASQISKRAGGPHCGGRDVGTEDFPSKCDKNSPFLQSNWVITLHPENRIQIVWQDVSSIAQYAFWTSACLWGSEGRTQEGNRSFYGRGRRVSSTVGITKKLCVKMGQPLT